MAIPQLARTLLPVAILFVGDSLKPLLPFSWLTTVAILTGIAVAGTVMAWRGSSGVTERTLWGLVAGWLMVELVSRAAGWLVRGPFDAEPWTLVWHLLLEGATIVVALALALCASRRVAYGGWFVVGLYIARVGTEAPASHDIALSDLPFRMYVPLALVAYMLVLTMAAIAASTFDQQSANSRRLWVISLVSVATAVVIGETLFFRYVAEFSKAAWWWAAYDHDTLSASISKAIDFLAWGMAAIGIYALLRLGWPDHRHALMTASEPLEQPESLRG